MNSNTEESTLNSSDTTTKKVTFNSVPTAANENSDKNENLQIKVKQHLLDNAKIFLAQYTDFQKG